jgi:2-oxo-3-hexenedioate decarboxylase
VSVEAFAHELIEGLGDTGPLATFTSRDPGFDLSRGYAVAERVHAARLARGERPVGRKIGFANRNIWDEYGVREPIWGFVYDTTLFRPRGGHASLAIGSLAEPRIEPEIVLHFKSAPPASRDEGAILASVDWIAHGFEIVQSRFPGWAFKAADTVACNGLHGLLVVGEQVPVASIHDCARKLREFRIALRRGDVTQSEGTGANVLDSPLFALAHLVELLARAPQFPPVGTGELVTTGTLTRALPVRAGETWSTKLSGIELPGLMVTFR